MLSCRWFVLLLTSAVVLGIASPYMVNPAPDMSAVVFAWFYWLPGIVTYWLSPEGDAAFMALSMAVYTIQYIVAFVLAALTVQAGRWISLRCLQS